MGKATMIAPVLDLTKNLAYAAHVHEGPGKD